MAIDHHSPLDIHSVFAYTELKSITCLHAKHGRMGQRQHALSQPQCNPFGPASLGFPTPTIRILGAAHSIPGETLEFYN